MNKNNSRLAHFESSLLLLTCIYVLNIFEYQVMGWLKKQNLLGQNSAVLANI